MVRAASIGSYTAAVGVPVALDFLVAGHNTAI
jgi:hypothetical protein